MRLIYLLTLYVLLPGRLLAQMPSYTEADSTLASIKAFIPISDRVVTSAQIAVWQIKAIKEAGYQVVINLAPANDKANRDEGFAAVSAGLIYVQIPVDFKNPQLRDLDFFFQIMGASEDRKVYVHCFANMRASSFMYLYRVIKEGVPQAEAWKAVEQVWTPNEVWAGFIKRALEVNGK